MPWRLQAMKDVVACDKLRGAGKQALIRRFPNGETHGGSRTSHEEPTRGTETSQYPEEKKENSISLVVASETETAQTVGLVPAGLWGRPIRVKKRLVRRIRWKAEPQRVTAP